MSDSGAASIHAELSQGVLTIRHGSTNERLLEIQTTGESWDRIWETLRSCGTVTYDLAKQETFKLGEWKEQS